MARQAGELRLLRGLPAQGRLSKSLLVFEVPKSSLLEFSHDTSPVYFYFRDEVLPFRISYNWSRLGLRQPFVCPGV